MKKTILLIYYIFFVTVLIYAELPVYNCYYNDSTLEIDGDLIESVWQHLPEIQLKYFNIDTYPQYNKTYVKSFYNDTYIYFGFLCYDTEIWAMHTNHDDPIYTEEGIEIFLQPNPADSQYIEIEISPLEIVFDAWIKYSNSIQFDTAKLYNLKGLDQKVSIKGSINNNTDLDEYWTVEISIDYRTNSDIFKIPLDEMKINFYRIERNFTTKYEQDFAWSPTYRWFHTPWRFGTIKFKLKKVLDSK